jgi:hypothetical protein
MNSSPLIFDRLVKYWPAKPPWLVVVLVCFVNSDRRWCAGTVTKRIGGEAVSGADWVIKVTAGRSVVGIEGKMASLGVGSLPYASPHPVGTAGKMAD